MDHARTSTNPLLVFHGLIFVYLTDAFSSTRLTGARKPVTFISVNSSAVALIKPPAFFLAGGAATPTSGTATIDLTNQVLAGNILRVTLKAIPLGTGSTLADGPFYDVTFEYTVQASSSLSAAATGLKGVINAGIAGTTITNGRIYARQFSTVTRAQIATGLALKYAACTGTSPQIIFNGAVTGGTTQNSYAIEVECLPKAPQLISLDASNLPSADAGLSFLGASDGGTLDLTAATTDINCGQSYNPLDTYLTGTTATFGGNGLEDLNQNAIREFQQIAGVTSTDTSEITIPNYFSTAVPRGLLILSASAEFPGQTNKTVIRNVRSYNYKAGYTKANTPVPFVFSAVAGDTEDLLYIDNYRPSITG